MLGHAYVYIVTNRRHGVLYTGVTSDLERRIAEHRARTVAGFTSRYNLTRLVWFEEAGSITDAIANEKQIKNRGRGWKIAMIERTNPTWADLSARWQDPAPPLVPRSAQDDGGVQGRVPHPRASH